MIRTVLLVAALILTTACKSREDSVPGTSQTATTDLPTIPVIDGATSPTWTYEDLKQFIDGNDLTTVDEFTAALALAEDSSLLSQALLVYAGTGDQHSSKEAPRVILFTPDASLIVSYAGEANDSEPENLEVIQFRYGSQRFEFFEIVFSEEDGVQFLDNAAGGLPSPDHCVSCHTDDLRPNWDTAPLWPGFFGAQQDVIATGTLEYDAAEQLLAYAATTPRFASLQPVQTWLRQGIETSKTANAFFGEQIAKLNFRRLARLLTSTPDHDRYKHALLAALLHCSPEDPGSKAPSDAQFAEEFPTVLAETKTAIAEHYLDKVANLAALDETAQPDPSPVFTMAETPDDVEVIAGLRYLLESRLSEPVSMANWSLTFSQSYAFAAGSLSIKDLAGYYFVHAFGDDGKMGKLHRQITSQGAHHMQASAESFQALVQKDKTAVCRLL